MTDKQRYVLVALFRHERRPLNACVLARLRRAGLVEGRRLTADGELLAREFSAARARADKAEVARGKLALGRRVEGALA